MRSYGQASREKEFVAALQKVVSALANRDSVGLSPYIDQKTGVYILNRPGIMDSYKHSSTIGFADSTYPNGPFYDKVKLGNCSTPTFPLFDYEKWSKTGTFVDTTDIDHLLSKIAIQLNSEIPGHVDTKKITEFKALENRSRRVVIAASDDNELIIYLSYIKNKWVLTIIDKVTADCST